LVTPFDSIVSQFEAERGQTFDQERWQLVVGRDGRARDQLFGKGEGAGHGLGTTTFRFNEKMRWRCSTAGRQQLFYVRGEFSLNAAFSCTRARCACAGSRCQR
jgi:hypothetical protein